MAKQVEIRQQYNDEMKKDTDKWFRKRALRIRHGDLGMVMPGEKRIEVQGLDEDSDSSSSKKVLKRQECQRSGQGDRRGRQGRTVYIQALDMSLFGFNGVEGQTVVSNGKYARRGARNDKLQTL